MSQPIKTDDAGDRALAQYLEPGEVFITNLLSGGARRIRTRLVPRGKEGRGFSQVYEGEERIPVSDYVANLLRGGQYNSVRVIQTAFDTSGNRIPNHVAVVGKRKPVPATG